uniref:SFRICE_035156 n=1 Tax=Spodoptera frugiperda TaxID=7108 RepID=A0A2H1VW28_SPOFR
MKGLALVLLCVALAHANSSCADDDQFLPHENCNQFYVCMSGEKIQLFCPNGLMYNTELETCDWHENVDCGDRLIPDEVGDENDQPTQPGGNNFDDPSEAPAICAADNSDGILIAHENCNQFYKCGAGRPIALECPENLLYNPEKEFCDWPANVDCGDRVR